MTAETIARLDYTTERFNIFYTHVERNQNSQFDLGLGRDVYMAWYRTEDVPRPICTVTLMGNYIEWVHVEEGYRRMGIASEVLKCLEEHLGCLNGEGVTEEGDAFCDAFRWREAK